MPDTIRHDIAAGLRYVTLDKAPELLPLLWSFDETWEEFMLHDPTAELYYPEMVDRYPSLQGLLMDGDEAIAKSHAIGFSWSGQLDDLPKRGWDEVLERGIADARAGRRPTAVSAILIHVRPEWQGGGLAGQMLVEMRRSAGRLGVTDLFAPVRPAAKAEVPHEPMSQYAFRVRPDGRPVDPWLRTHQRVGGEILDVAPVSMIIPGSLDQWRAWTGLPFDRSGAVAVPGGLVPVYVDVEQDHAIYVEPSVWVRHRVPAEERGNDAPPRPLSSRRGRGSVMRRAMRRSVAAIGPVSRLVEARRRRPSAGTAA